MNDIIQLSGDNDLFTIHLVVSQKQSSKDSSSKITNNQTASNQLTDDVIGNFPTLSNESWNNLNEIRLLGPNNEAVREAYVSLLSQYYQYISYYHLTSPPLFDYNSYVAFASNYMQPVNLIPNDSNSQSSPANNNVNEHRVANNNDANQAEPEEINRDWSEWLFFISKSLIVLSIIYFYSSLFRLLLFIVFCFILYFSKNVLNVLQNPHNNNNNDLDENEAPPVVPNEGTNEANTPNTDTDDTNDNRRETFRYSGLRFVWVFVSSLFTSLIPDPVPIN